MLNYRSLSLQNWVLFNKTQLKLDTPGLTVIGGANHTRKGIRSNGAGKSLLLSSIPTLWYGSGPTILATKSRARRDAFYRKGSNLNLHFDIDNTKYSISKYIQGQSLRYDVHKNGEPLEFTTARAAEEWMASFAITEEQFYTTVYMDSRRPVLTMLGQGSQRFQFFSDLFRLESFDNIRMALETGKAAIRDERAVLVAQEQELSELKGTIEDLRESLKKWSAETIVEVEEHLNSIREWQSLLKVLQRKAEELKKRGCDKIAYNPKEYTALKQKVADLELQSVLFHEYSVRAEEGKKAQREIDALKKQIAAIPERKEDEVYLDTTLVVDQQFGKKESEIAEEMSKLRRQKDRTPTVDDDKLQKLLAKHNKEYDKLAHARLLLEALKVATDNKCPVCGSKFKADLAQKRKMIREQKAICKQLEIDVPKMYKTYTDAKEMQSRHNEIVSKLRQLKDERSKLQKKRLPKEKIKAITARIKELKQRTDLSLEMNSIQIPMQPKSKPPKKDPSPQLEKAHKQLAKLAKGRRWYKFLEQCSENGVTPKAFEEEKQDITKVTKELAKAKHNTTLLKDAEKRQAKLKGKIEGAKKHLERAQAMDALLGAYGNMGLKRSACATLANKVQENLNAISPLMFDYYTFHFDVTSKDFRILFEDKVRGASFDVRNLSGSESRAFTILSTMALLPLLPDRYRSNLLILDEFEVNMDETLRDRFVNQVLVTMQSIAPHVIIITPFPEYYPEGRHCTVTKKGPKSQLVWVES